MNKSLSFLGLFLLGLLIFGVIMILPQHSVYASCGVDPQTKQPIPCPNDPSKSDYSKKNQATAVPSKTPIPTDTPKPAVVVDQPLNPNASCPPAPAAAASNTTPPSPALSSFFDIPPLLLGGGGTLLGILIGLLLGGVFMRNRVNGDGIVGPDRGWSGPITTPGELLPAVQKVDKFDKDKFDKWQKADAGGDASVNGDGMPAGFDVFHKGQDAGFADGSVHTAMGDGSVHPSNDDAAGTFMKRGGAGITDGTSLSGNSSAPSVSENPEQTTHMDDWEHLNGDG